MAPRLRWVSLVPGLKGADPIVHGVGNTGTGPRVTGIRASARGIPVEFPMNSLYKAFSITLEHPTLPQRGWSVAKETNMTLQSMTPELMAFLLGVAWSRVRFTVQVRAAE